MSTTAVRQQHATWLGLIDTQGPFLTLPVLARALHDGLEPVSKRDWNALRPAYQTWAADRGSGTKAAQAHADWVHHVVVNLLDWDTDADFTGPFEKWSHSEPEHDVTVNPAFTVNDDTGTPVVLGFVHPYDTPLTGRVKDDGWAANRLDRAAATLRGTGVEFGLVTDGRWWALVWAPQGGATAHAIWDAVLWLEDRMTLDAFTTLASRRRFLAVADDATLKGMLVASLDSQEEVTDQLGKQVRAAAEFLVESFGRADYQEGGQRLAAVENDDIYSGAVTVLMRLVFMFCAEERRLLPADSDFYLRAYSVSALADRLAQEAAERGESTLEHSTAAWHQLLATFRIVHAGSSHQSFSMPGYGGSIFDPTKYPWLEGDERRGPIPVDDRTIHHILRGLTRLTFREKGVTESRKISYRALDVEQIGYVYEGLLDHTATRATDTTLGFAGKYEPEITLSELEAQAARGESSLIDWLSKSTGLTVNAVRKGFARPADPSAASSVRRGVYAACDNDNDLTERVMAYAPMLREDPRGLPMVYLKGRLFVTASSMRSDTGTHYTPRDLAERVVATTLDAVAYRPGPLNTDDRGQWKLLRAADILKLRVADIAMGSGAFLVASCRYLADRLLEAVLNEDPSTLEGELATVRALAVHRAALPTVFDAEIDEALLYARRLVTERCIYGVDVNPMAVEMAKLSLWLVTAARDKPFGFLDHRLVAGDSLLGLTSAEQLKWIHPDITRGRSLHGDALVNEAVHVDQALLDASRLRMTLAHAPATDLRAVQGKRELLLQADARISHLDLLADAISGAAIAAATTSAKNLDVHVLRVAEHVRALFSANAADAEEAMASLRRLADTWLGNGPSSGSSSRRPLQWVTTFPEVFLDEQNPGFDAIVGNPPFVGNKYWNERLGADFQSVAAMCLNVSRVGKPDLCVLFLRKANDLLVKERGAIGLIATSSIREGDSRKLGPEAVAAGGMTLYAALGKQQWPGTASVHVSLLWFSTEECSHAVLDGRNVEAIGADLTEQTADEGLAPFPLASGLKGFAGVDNSQGEPLILLDGSVWQARLADVASPYLRQYVTGDDITSSAMRRLNRWIVDTGSASLETVQATCPVTAQFLEEVVRPRRTEESLRSYKGLSDRWWQLWRHREPLFESLRERQTCAVVPAVSKYLVVQRASTKHVYTNKVRLIHLDSTVVYPQLLSASFEEWAWKHSGRMGEGINVTVSSAIATFPLLQDFEGEGLADEWDGIVWDLAETRDCGLTSVLNLLHDPACEIQPVQRLRSIRENLTAACLSAYGWTDLAAEFDFRGRGSETRHAMPDETNRELLRRMLQLNHARHANELAHGLVGEQGAGRAGSGKRRAVKSRSGGSHQQNSLFDERGGL